jgi:hypothetical protein
MDDRISTTDLAEIIKKLELEATTQGTCGLDREIAELVGTYSAPDRGDPQDDWPNYTTSLDAALSLVPEGYRWEINPTPLRLHMPYGFRARVYALDFDWDPVDDLYQPTAPLALAYAALKARQRHG